MKGDADTDRFRLTGVSCYSQLVVAATNRKKAGQHVFETIAFLSTVGFVVVFVFLFQMDRASRRADETDDSGGRR